MYHPDWLIWYVYYVLLAECSILTLALTRFLNLSARMILMRSLMILLRLFVLSMLSTLPMRCFTGYQVEGSRLRLSCPGTVSSKPILIVRSANNIGGEAYVLKLRRVPTLSVEDMLIQSDVTTKRERWSNYPCKICLMK